MEKILELTDRQLRKRALVLRWAIFSVLVAAIAVSVCVFLFTDNLKISAAIPIILVPAINLPLSLKLITLEDERNRRMEKYASLYAMAESNKDLHLLN